MPFDGPNVVVREAFALRGAHELRELFGLLHERA
jgi:hypothetical protein